VSSVALTSLVTKLLGAPEEVDTCARFPGHLHRWMIFANQRFKVYLHRSSNEELTVDLQPYPKRLLSIGFVTSNKGGSAGELSPLADRAAWMVLITKSSHGLREINHP